MYKENKDTISAIEGTELWIALQDALQAVNRGNSFRVMAILKYLDMKVEYKDKLDKLEWLETENKDNKKILTIRLRY